MLIPTPPIFRKRSGRFVDNQPTATPVVPLVLVSAVYTEGNSVRLVFNQAVDIDDIVTDSFNVFDGPGTGLAYVGESAGQVDATTITIFLVDVGEYTGGSVLLSVDAGNGIVPASGGAVWTGVTSLHLPFP